MKKCIRCQTIKNIDDFHLDKTEKDGHTFYCKQCNRERAKAWGKENPDKRKKAYQLWAKKNPDRVKFGRDKWRNENIDKTRLAVKSWQINYPERAKVSCKKNNEKRRSTIKGKLDHRMSTAILRVLRGEKAGTHWEVLVGYDVSRLMKSIEKQFKEDMSWSNYGKWHIDHKIPLTAFNYERPEDIDFKRCWSLKNLQPLWAKENISKSDKVLVSFQPSLLI
jgi:hypothetical protein